MLYQIVYRARLDNLPENAQQPCYFFLSKLQDHTGVLFLGKKPGSFQTIGGSYLGAFRLYYYNLNV